MNQALYLFSHIWSSISDFLLFIDSGAMFIISKYSSTWRGSYSSTSRANETPLFLNLLNSTNWTKSLFVRFPLLSTIRQSSSSSSCIMSKFPFPIPTMIKLNGSLSHWTNKSKTSSLSWIYPSVRMNRIMYSVLSAEFLKLRQVSMAYFNSSANLVGPENFKDFNILRYSAIMFFFW